MVRMLTDTKMNGETYLRGEKYDLPDAVEARWIKAGIAVDVPPLPLPKRKKEK